jgi:hypothetical protein
MKTANREIGVPRFEGTRLIPSVRWYFSPIFAGAPRNNAFCGQRGAVATLASKGFGLKTFFDQARDGEV